MSSFLSGNRIKSCLHAEGRAATKRALISTAFCTPAMLSDLIATISSEIEEKALIVRWRLSDFLVGASDPEIFNVCLQNEWPLYAQPDLHAKIYLFDKAALVGSANLTSRGLSGTPPSGNLEAGFFVDSPPEVSQISKWFKAALRDAYIVDEEVYEETIKIIKENKIDLSSVTGDSSKYESISF